MFCDKRQGGSFLSFLSQIAADPDNAQNGQNTRTFSNRLFQSKSVITYWGTLLRVCARYNLTLAVPVQINGLLCGEVKGENECSGMSAGSKGRANETQSLDRSVV